MRLGRPWSNPSCSCRSGSLWSHGDATAAMGGRGSAAHPAAPTRDHGCTCKGSCVSHGPSRGTTHRAQHLPKWLKPPPAPSSPSHLLSCRFGCCSYYGDVGKSAANLQLHFTSALRWEEQQPPLLELRVGGFAVPWRAGGLRAPAAALPERATPAPTGRARHSRVSLRAPLAHLFCTSSEYVQTGHS